MAFNDLKLANSGLNISELKEEVHGHVKLVLD